MTDRTKAMRGVSCALAALPLLAAAPPPAPAPVQPQAQTPAGATPAASAASAAGERQNTFISPMGEPFRSNPGGTAPDLLWFRQADRNGDGRLTLLEMRADAFRFFKTLDLNHDGEIDPDELQHYETDVAPEVNVMDTHSGMERMPDSVITSNDGPQDAFSDLPQIAIAHHKPRARAMRGAGNFSFFDLPEPVAAADSDFNRGVSVKEFDEAAQKRFLLLDADHDGYLGYAKLQALRR